MLPLITSSVAKKETATNMLTYPYIMDDGTTHDETLTSTRFLIVRCALEDIHVRIEDLPPTRRRDELAVEALSCSEATARLEGQIGSPVEAREALVRRIVDLEIALLELGRVPVVGSLSETEPPPGSRISKSRSPQKYADHTAHAKVQRTTSQ